VSDDIVEFIKTQLDEDEAVAKAAVGGPWWSEDGYLYREGPDNFGEVWILPPHPDEYEKDAATGEHIARHNPAVVLVEIEAKRRVLARHGPMDPDWAESQRAWHDKYGGDSPFELEPPPCIGCGGSGSGGRHGEAYSGRWRTRDFTRCPELRDLAAPYAGRPGFKPKWRLP